MINEKKIESVISLNGRERYMFFIRKVADFEEVWGLFDDGWAMASDDQGRESVPFWPEPDFAAICCEGSWLSYSPKSITLDIFVSKWLPGLEGDGKLVAVFPTPKNRGVVVGPETVLRDLEEELEQYL